MNVNLLVFCGLSSIWIVSSDAADDDDLKEIGPLHPNNQGIQLTENPTKKSKWKKLIFKDKKRNNIHQQTGNSPVAIGNAQKTKINVPSIPQIKNPNTQFEENFKNSKNWGHPLSVYPNSYPLLRPGRPNFAAPHFHQPQYLMYYGVPPLGSFMDPCSPNIDSPKVHATEATKDCYKLCVMHHGFKKTGFCVPKLGCRCFSHKIKPKLWMKELFMGDPRIIRAPSYG